MKKNSMVYGAAESTVKFNTTDGTDVLAGAFDSSKWDNAPDALKALLAGSDAVRFGRGDWAEDAGEGVDTLTQIRTAAVCADNKVRLVSGVDGTGSGVVMAGNQVVSSKILDITVDGNDGYTKSEDEFAGDVPAGSDGKLYKANGAFKRAEKVVVKWFGLGHSNRKANGEPLDTTNFMDTVGIHTTQFEIVDPDAINELIENLDVRVKNLEDYAADTDNLLVETGSALTVTPKTVTKTVTGIDGVDFDQTFASWEVAVNVDDDTVQILPENADADAKNVLKVAKYTLLKVGNPDLADVDGAAVADEQFTSQYQFVMTDPDGSRHVVGDTIDIIKDFLLKEAHVCTFNLCGPNGVEIKWDGVDNTFTKADGTTESGLAATFGASIDTYTGLPWAALADGTFEMAVKGKGIKFGHTYLHLVLNTRGDDEKTVTGNGTGKGNDLTTDVYLDFTDIFHTFSADEVYIHLDKGVGKFSLDEAAVAEMADRLIETNHVEAGYDSLSDHIKAIDASILDLETSTNAIEDAYVKVVDIDEPSADNEQFNKVRLTKQVTEADGTRKDVEVEFDIANEAFYQALNDALSALKENDTQLATLLTWEPLL